MATSKIKDVLTQGARGWAAGLAGLPGDLEGLARLLIKYGASPGSYVDRNMSETPVLPTSAFYNEWLPGGDWETPEGGVAQAIGTALGGVGATTLAKPIVKAGDLAAKYGVPLAEKAVRNAMVPSTLSKQAGVIKAPGGNWLSGSVEDALKGLKKQGYTREEAIASRSARLKGIGVPERNGSGMNAYGEPLSDADLIREMANPMIPANMQPGLLTGEHAAMNSWIDKQLTKYVKNDMATERDPVRALAERGVLHTDLPNTTINPPRPRVLSSREREGFPAEGSGVSGLAKRWEAQSDAFIDPGKAGEFLQGSQKNARNVDTNPWLAKVPPETPVYEPGVNARPDNLGFDHLIDELRNATNPNSGLPADLLLKYDALDRVSVPQAVERVAKINAWRAAQKAEANMLKANNAATVLHKEYPEAGMKWVELKSPSAKGIDDLTEEQASWYSDYISEGVSPERALREASNRGDSTLKDALKYEGDTMGHCVGGYCDKVADGSTRIFSLRDAKGRPHVTIETRPGRLSGKMNIEDWVASYEKNHGQGSSAAYLADHPEIEQAFVPEIVQIKGKANRAPNPEYLPFVQDFVKSQKWSDVRDLQNTGLKRLSDMGDEPMIKAAREKHGDYMSQEEWDALMKGDGYAQGGLVTQNDYDPMLVDALAAELESEFA